MADKKWKQIKLITVIINILPVFLWLNAIYEYNYVNLALLVSLVQLLVNITVIVLIPLKENDYRRLESTVKTLKCVNKDLFEENRNLYKNLCRKNYLENIVKENKYE